MVMNSHRIVSCLSLSGEVYDGCIRVPPKKTLAKVDRHQSSRLPPAPKTTVEKIKKEGVEWIFIDEDSMITSKIWSVVRDIKTEQYMVLSLIYLVIFTNYQVLNQDIKTW